MESHVDRWKVAVLRRLGTLLQSGEKLTVWYERGDCYIEDSESIVVFTPTGDTPLIKREEIISGKGKAG